jgi:hypothetical protein
MAGQLVTDEDQRMSREASLADSNSNSVQPPIVGYAHDEEELSASFIRVTRIGELGTTPAVTSNRRTVGSSETSVLTKLNGVTSQKTPFFIRPMNQSSL